MSPLVAGLHAVGYVTSLPIIRVYEVASPLVAGGNVADQGCLLIADITGYTEFFSSSELDHARDSLRGLLTVLIEQTKPPLVVSTLEGDAVFSYAPSGSFAQGQTFVDAVEATYSAFRRILERMVLNTTCTCNACRNLPHLDLKFFIHYGEFALETLGQHSELLGSDVNLIHRLTKNNIVEKIGHGAYAAYTEAAVQQLDLGEFAMTLVEHEEEYEHLGKVTVYVQDLHPVWERKRTQSIVGVQPKDALVTWSYISPFEPAQLWDHITKPEYWSTRTGSDRAGITKRTGGRTGTGSIYQCAHGKSVYDQTIVEWEPFERFSWESRFPLLRSVIPCTIRLEQVESGTRVTVAYGRSRGPLLGRVAFNAAIKLAGTRDIKKGMRAVAKKLAEEVQTGELILPQVSEISEEEIEKAASQSLDNFGAASKETV